jgi:hypothetical protein
MQMLSVLPATKQTRLASERAVDDLPTCAWELCPERPKNRGNDCSKRQPVSDRGPAKQVGEKDENDRERKTKEQ